MREDKINRILELNRELTSYRNNAFEDAADLVDEVLGNMIDKYEEDYKYQVPECDQENIDIYAYYEWIEDNDELERFKMYINGNEYTDEPDYICARNFDILETVASAEGIRVRRMTKEELLEHGDTDAIGGYKFSINRRNLERVIEHPQVLKMKKTIPKTLESIK